MNLTVITPPATEPLTIQEVMSHLNLDESNQEPAPGALTAALISPAVAGNVEAGAHRYLVVFVTSTGKTQAGIPSASVTVANPAVNGKVSLTGIPLGGSRVTSRELYRTAANGSSYLLLATLADNTTTTYTDNVADASLGAGAPSVNTTDDPAISRMITSARVAVEQILDRRLITQTLDAGFEGFPLVGHRKYDREIRLMPLQSVTSISYIDTEGVTQVLATDQYGVDIASKPSRIFEAYGTSWPSFREQPNSVVIRFVAGYGNASQVPTCIKDWMLMRISTLWENREQEVVGSGLSAVTLSDPLVDGLLDSERVMGRT